jgi:hypothetical protein
MLWTALSSDALAGRRGPEPPARLSVDEPVDVAARPRHNVSEG